MMLHRAMIVQCTWILHRAWIPRAWRFLLLAWLAAGWGSLSAEEPFDDVVLPMLTRAGCNSGACHGAAAGRGGFRLSLYGQDPAQDWREVTRALHGRRVQVSDPEASLLLRKAGEFVEHGGGQRLEPDGRRWNRIVDWIASGAPREKQPQDPVIGLRVEPSTVTVPFTGDRASPDVPLRVWVRHAGGREREMTSEAIVTPLDRQSVASEWREEDAELRLRVLRPGRHVVLVRVRDQVTSIQVLRPFAGRLQAAADASEQATSTIDRAIARRLDALVLEPRGVADERTLLRRVTLDLAGRLPTREELRRFESERSFNDERSPGWYERWVDRLLASPEARDNWGHWMATSLRADQMGPEVAGQAAGDRFLRFIRGQLDQETGVVPLMAKLVAADGALAEQPAGLFYRLGRDGRRRSEAFAELMLGSRLGCANCHDHPLDVWTQDDYHGLAALLAGIEVDTGVRWRAGATNTHPATGLAATPRLPDGQVVDAAVDPRPRLAAWVQGSGRRAVAENWCNRIWEKLMGRGLVHPVDDHRVTNPGSHPRLLQQLAAKWLEEDTELWWLIREVVTSEAYRRESGVGLGPAAAEGLQNFAVRGPKPLRQAIYLDALGDVTGVRFLSETTEYDRGRWVTRIDAPVQMTVSTGGTECEPQAGCTTWMEDSLAGRLAEIAGPVVNQRIAAEGNRIDAWSKRLPEEAEACVTELFEMTVSRPPTAEQRRSWSEAIRRSENAAAVWEDLVWSLLTSEAFRQNH